MREAVHIFLKDSRQLRYPIAMVLAWAAIFVIAGASRQSPVQRYEGWFDNFGVLIPMVSDYVLPVAWWFLISQAFHAEALPGDRQFWLTRPYRRASLFGAKALFVLAYITLPLALAQATVIALKGFPLGPHLTGILWAQVLILAVVVLPAAALAAMTSTLAQFVAVSLAAPVLFFGKRFLTPWLALEWIRSAVAIVIIVAVTAAVLYVQFSRRRTGTSRTIALGGILALVVIVPLFSWRTAFALQTYVDRSMEGTIEAELGPTQNRAPKQDPTWPIQLSFRVLGLAGGTALACEDAEVTFESSQGVWRTGLQGPGHLQATSTMFDGCTVQIPGNIVTAVAQHQVDLHAILYLTVFGVAPATRVAINQPPVFVRDAGLCSGATVFRQFTFQAQTVDNSLTVVACQPAFHDLRGQIQFLSTQGKPPHATRPYSYSPFPADLRIQPVSGGAFANFDPVEAVTVAAQRPIAHVRTVVNVRGIRLLEYQ